MLTTLDRRIKTSCRLARNMLVVVVVVARMAAQIAWHLLVLKSESHPTYNRDACINNVSLVANRK